MLKSWNKGKQVKFDVICTSALLINFEDIEQNRKIDKTLPNGQVIYTCPIT